MWNAILKWLSDNYPIVGVVLAVILVTWWIASCVSKYLFKLNEVEDKVNNLPCESHHQSIQEHSSMKSTLDSINEQVTEISKWIMHLDGNMIDILSQKCSPRMMTALGKNLFEISGARKTIDENADFLIQEIAGRNPMTPYDVEDVALDVLLGNLAHPLFNEIKNFIYYQPEEVELVGENDMRQKVRISLCAIIKLMSLELRDRFLAAHPEILASTETQPEETESDSK